MKCFSNSCIIPISSKECSWYVLRPKEKLFVSCNPTLTSFYSKKSLKRFFYRPTYPMFFSDRYRNQTILFSWPKGTLGGRGLICLRLKTYRAGYTQLEAKHDISSQCRFCRQMWITKFLQGLTNDAPVLENIHWVHRNLS